ncbi:MAG: right-handed parallel beta-helix repeat-containing protein [Bernardetiaceae bacterium]|nr:right-handed parallel beta-helix repeat-containing protein [Bernardetiaceae bacterium]
MKIWLVLLALPLATWVAPTPRTYYVSPTGHDDHDGLSPRTAWRTLARANRQQFAPGEQLRLAGGVRFAGPLLLDHLDAGDPQRVFTVGSFGRGKALIEAGAGPGVLVRNASGVAITNLVVEGLGVGANQASGIELLADSLGIRPRNLAVQGCQVSGFGRYGILVHGVKHPQCGLEQVKIKNCTATANGEAGIASWCHYPSVAHRDVYVGHCQAFRNRGILTKTDNHSGNGIVMGGVDTLLVEYCQAYQNGADNRSLGGGPVGIWLWNTHHGIIQHCEAHHNYAGAKYDGGGFDIDGGSSNCTIRQCRSHHNEGAGYLVCEFGSPLPFANNALLDNESRHDGLNNSYGAISVSGTDAQHQVTNTIIKGNRVYVSTQGRIAGTPSALYFYAWHFKNIHIVNNTFVVEDQAQVLRCDTLLHPSWVTFKGNQFKISPQATLANRKRCPGASDSLWQNMLFHP